jgi:hypothetical protein
MQPTTLIYSTNVCRSTLPLLSRAPPLPCLYSFSLVPPPFAGSFLFFASTLLSPAFFFSVSVC